MARMIANKSKYQISRVQSQQITDQAADIAPHVHHYLANHCRHNYIH